MTAYAPLGTRAWERIAEFVLAVVAATIRRLPYLETDVRTAVARHVHWAHTVSGYPLDRTVLFRRDIIAFGVSELPYRSDATKGRRRALLLRVAEELGIVPAALPPLYGSEPSAPYCAAEIADIRVWAGAQPEKWARSARTLVALGLGAGLVTRDLCHVTGRDILDDGRAVLVTGEPLRRVVVWGAWADDLAESAASAADVNAPLFHPSSRFYTNKVHDFLNVSWGDQLHPLPQRMRATWLVERMLAGVPVNELTYQAGVKSLGALARFERYLPPVPAVAASDSPGRR